jgi:hypothetical protein
MTNQHPSPRRGAPHRVRAQRRRSVRVVAAGIAALFSIALGVAASGPPETASALMQTSVFEISQTLTVATQVEAAAVTRSEYGATPGIPTLVAGGSNYDWATLVLISGGWSVSDENLTVLLRWMRQENGPDNWWNRNNPLNNGWGSGGGGGTGRYANLVIAAQKAAEALTKHPGYREIIANLAASSPTAVTESAIWASPWASGHYANGGHWHYTEVPRVVAPASAWG